ncbi:hypothetical protein HYH02_011677 [Chlamydomonas schloesseri]|uniref:Uncharacterized protein n=1 Tax=Chlamydomonas schloesseri TaxID=2026947 RepID=A0A835T9B9_9CHLO|nr:hypothetical protein HYH02_011677 [Chlamydomonas schloesseri]|eukprot:KAG2436174.1 hypothetical protein HYH02_011677 [Chlamydomonas schloesseri]
MHSLAPAHGGHRAHLAAGPRMSVNGRTSFSGNSPAAAAAAAYASARQLPVAILAVMDPSLEDRLAATPHRTLTARLVSASGSGAAPLPEPLAEQSGTAAGAGTVASTAKASLMTSLPSGGNTGSRRTL